MKPSTIVCAFVLATVACAPQADNQAKAAGDQPTELGAEDVAAIKTEIDQYIKRGLAGDFEGQAEAFASDIVVYAPNMAPMTGRAAWLEWVKTFPKLTSFTLEATEVVGRGDLAYVTGTYAINTTLPDGSAATDRGSFIEIHRKQADGRWPYTRLIWHSDNSPAPTK